MHPPSVNLPEDPLRPRCPVGESYQLCEWRCRESCDKTLCSRIRVGCEEGCFCDGYPNIVRINDQCVPRDQCAEIGCMEGQEWTLGNECTGVCHSEGMICGDKYWYGCFCARGLVLIDGKCVDPERCITECPEDREYQECGNPCNHRCPDAAVHCLKTRCRPGCYCKEGLVEINGECVDPSNCPGVECCGPNEVYRWGNNCSDTCGLENQICDHGLRLGCFCKDGFRNVKGKCIPVEECPTACTEVCPLACPEGMQYNWCGNSCDNTCDDRLCVNKCIPGCYCTRRGYMPVGGKCINKEKYCSTVWLELIEAEQNRRLIG